MQKAIDESVKVLIVAPASRFRGALRSILRGMPRVGDVGQVDDGPSALKAAAVDPPALVFLDAALPNDEAWAVLGQIKAEWPQARCIVLTEGSQQRTAAEADEADAVLIKGFTTPALAETVARLLSEIDETQRESNKALSRISG